MKKRLIRFKKFSALLMAGLLVCLPAAQASAAGSFDVLADISGQILFPGDSMINIGEGIPVLVDGAEAVLETPGSWTNTDSGKAYKASLSEDGSSLQLTSAGYVLTVESGKSSTSDESGNANHYTPSEEEYSADSMDKAYYAAGTTVKLSAEAEKDGQVFAEWKSEDQEIVFADSASPETTMVMPERGVTVTALYKEAAPQTYSVSVADGVVSSPAGENTFTAGTPVSVSANDHTAEGLVFVGWSVDSGNVEIDIFAQTVDFVMPEGEVVLTAHYEQAQTETSSLPEEAPEEVPVTSAPQEETPDTGAAQEGTPETAVLQDETPSSDIVVDPIPNDSGETLPEQSESQTAESPAAQAYSVYVENGTIGEEAGGGPYEAGSVISVTASDYSADGLTFSSWSVESLNVEIDLYAPTVSFIMPEGDVVLTAHYEQAVETDPTQPETSSVLDPAQEFEAQPESPESESQQSETPQSETPQSETPQSETPQSETQQSETPQSETPQSETPQSETQPVQTEAPQIKTYPVTVGNGTVIVVQGTVTSVDAATWTAEEGAVITVTANPNPAGQAFTGWTITNAQGVGIAPEMISGSVYSSTIQLAVKEPMNFVAQYEGIAYGITVNNGTANYATAVTGAAVTIKANQPEAGKEFDHWNVDSGNIALADAYSAATTFTMPSAEVTVSAVYRLKEYSLTVQNGDGGKSTYHMGDEAVISAWYPEEGKIFDAWVAVSGNVDFDADSYWKTTFEMPASDVTVKATYQNGPSANDNKILELVAGGQYYTGETIKFSASGAGMDSEGLNPGDYRYVPTGYQIGNVTGSWQSSPYTTSMSIKAAGEYTLKVNFEKEVYDGSKWKRSGKVDTKSVTFKVVPNTSVATGDSTPIFRIAAIAGVSCVLFVLLLVVFIRRRRK